MITMEDVIRGCILFPPDETALDELGTLVQMHLTGLTKPIGTGALIERLLPGCTRADTRYRRLVTALTNLRKRTDAAHQWEYTGTKNHFGKPKLHWLPQ